MSLDIVGSILSTQANTVLLHFCSIQQMQWLSVMLILVVALVQFTWMMLGVLVVKPTSLNALGALLSAASMATHRMLEFDVKVWINDKVMLYFSGNFNSRDNCKSILQQKN